MEDKDVWITTDDNPFSPFTEWDQWYGYDERNGYHTSEYVARLIKDAPGLSDSENYRALLDSLKQIVEFDLFGIYQIVYNDNDIKRIKQAQQ